MKFSIFSFSLLLLLAACAGPQAQPEAKVEDKPLSLSLKVHGKTRWTWRIDDQSIRGNGVSLQRADDVFFGFVGTEKLRLRRMTDGEHEWLSTPAGNMAIQRQEGGVVMAGSLWDQRHGAAWDGGVLLLSNTKFKLGLKREGEGQALVDPDGQIRLVFSGGDPDPILRRPEILWLLLRKVLPEAKRSLVDPPRAMP